MKRFLALALAALFLMTLSLPVLADALAPEPLPEPVQTGVSIVPWLVIAVVVIAAALLAWFLVKRRKK